MQSIAGIIDSWTQPGCSLIISSAEHTLLFWSLFRRKYACRLLSFPSNSGDFAHWSGELSQSFLGQSTVYWGVLPGVQAKNSKVRQQVIQFLKTYNGPHAVWVLVEEEAIGELSSCRRVLVPATIAGAKLFEIAELFGMERSVAVLDNIALVPTRSTLLLDTAVQLLLHAGYVPIKQRDAAMVFLHRLLPQEISLVNLAELFFKKEWPAFFKEWSTVVDLYGDMFWISFWTEQLWRAYWVCWYMQRGQQTKARSMSYRLPLSFCTAGWRQASLLTLRQQYEHMAFLDTAIKQGSYFSANEAVVGLTGAR